MHFLFTTLFVTFHLVGLGLGATNGSSAHSPNMSANALTSNIPRTVPLVSLSFTPITLEPIPLSSSAFYLCIIENQDKVCNPSPHDLFGASTEFKYASVGILVENAEWGKAESLRYYDVCVVMRGLAEWMTFEGQFFEWNFQILVSMRLVGRGCVKKRTVRTLDGARQSEIVTS